MFNATGLLESVFVLISSPAMTDRAAVFMAVQELLCYLMDSRGGLLYLSSKVEVVNNIIRVFIQNPVCIVYVICRHEIFPEFSQPQGHSRGTPGSGLIFMGGGVPYIVCAH